MELLHIRLKGTPELRSRGQLVPTFSRDSFAQIIAVLAESPNHALNDANIRARLSELFQVTLDDNAYRVRLSDLRKSLNVSREYSRSWTVSVPNDEAEEICRIERKSGTLRLVIPHDDYCIIQADGTPVTGKKETPAPPPTETDTPPTPRPETTDGNYFEGGRYIESVPFFTGRTDDLDRLRQMFAQNDTAAVTQAIAGLGGIGKTSLARQYAYTFANEYRYQFFANAANEVALTQSYRELLVGAGFDLPPDAPPEAIIGMARQWMNTQTGWLLILDNADFAEGLTARRLRDFLPDRPQGHLLITSRTKQFDGCLGIGKHQVLELDRMLEEDAVRFLVKRVHGAGFVPKGDEEVAVRELARELDGLPLALEQAAAYMAAKGQSFRVYLTNYKALSLKLLNRQKPQTNDYPHTVETTWQINFEAVEAESEAAAELLRLAAFLSPEAIPIEVVITAAAQSIFPAITEHFAEAFAVDETLRETLIFDAWDTLLEPLTRYSLAVKYQERPFPENADAEEQKKWRDETQRLQHTFRVHRLVQAVVREQLGGNRQQIAEQTLSAVSELFPRIENYDKLLPERFLPSALSVVPLVKKFNITSEYSLTLLLSIGSHYIATGKYASAEEFFLQSKDVLYALHTEEKIARISVWNVLANAYFGQAKYEDAELSWLKDLDLKNKYLRSDDPLLCYTLSGLAGIYRIHGKFTQSEKYYKNALIISRLASPNQPLLVASILNNMAELYRYQNRLAEAEPLYIEALSIRISHPPYNHHDIATNRGNLAGLYELTSRFKEAELLYSDALSTLRSLYGYHHPDVGISMNNLAGLYCRQSRFRDAEPLLIESVKVLESVLGRNHPTTKMALQNLEYLFSLKEPKRAD